ncbi:MAG: hypothetical protein NUV56_03240, partial [Candidatus Uhrbacteria bacterium]|nr:hypothetical protein [Candidatus Uhrbacteria bacterium]
VICVTPVDADIYEVFVAGSSFWDFTYAPNHVWEPGAAWLSLVTETNGSDEVSDEAPELILERSQVCATYHVDWGDEFVLNGLAKMSGDGLRLLVDASLERHRVVAVKVDGQGDACLLENDQFRCVRP